MGLYLSAQMQPFQSFLPLISAPQHAMGMPCRETPGLPCNKTTAKQGLGASRKGSDHTEGMSLDQAEPLMASVGLVGWGEVAPPLWQRRPLSPSSILAPGQGWLHPYA